MLLVAVPLLKVILAEYQLWSESLLTSLSDGTMTPKELPSLRLAFHYPLVILSVEPALFVKVYILSTLCNVFFNINR